MTRFLDPQNCLGRFSILGLLVLPPFLEFLARHRYDGLTAEAAVATSVLLAGCALAAVAARSERWFRGIVLAALVAQYTSALRASFLPGVRPRWVLVGLVGLLVLLMHLFGRHFFPLLVAFLVGVLMVDLGQVVVAAAGDRRGSAAPARKPPALPHVLYLIFDEHLGLAGFPQSIPECQQARKTLSEVLARHKFQVYPNAFVNYPATWDSIPSVVNFRLLPKTSVYAAQRGPRSELRENALFERFLAQGYRIRAYSPDFVRQTSQSRAFSGEVYAANDLSAWRVIATPWSRRLEQMALLYLEENALLARFYRDVLPPSFQRQLIRVGPLAIRGIWPDQLREEIQAATEKTLFFAHLLTPHYPYVYRSDGSLRTVEEWRNDEDLELYSRAEYESRYRRYAEQVIYLAKQLDGFLHSLRESGMLDTMTVILHGDHGSRLRLLKESEREQWRRLRVTTPDCWYSNRYDYVSAPELQDLLDRFSTILAVKPQAATGPAIVEEKGSVLYFLDRLWGNAKVPEPGVNSVYLFNADGTPREIRMLDIWQANEQP